MLKFCCIFLIFLVPVNCQTWVSRACLVNRNGYYMKIIQDVMNRIENDIKWCNFKLSDVNQEINERLFKWHAQGTVNYTNGFLLNFRKIDVTNIGSQFSSRTVNNTSENLLSASGVINIRNLNVGYDVIANIDGQTHHFTGVFSFTLFALRCMITRNLNTNEVVVTTSLSSTTPAGRRMVYMPQNSISEMLSRHFAAYHASASFIRWGQEIIAPIAADVASRTELPEIRFDNKC